MKTAAYCRISREDGDRTESDSIGNQKALLLDFLTHRPELGPTEFYIDDGYTGTNFERPAFRRMETDIKAGRICCVVVKDLSRFGRDYIETGRYLERWLPEHGVRFIAVNDQIDSDRGAYDMLLPVKNVFNTQYAKDISQKVKSAFRTKQRRGEFIGAFAPYGYRKDPDNRNHLLPDPDAAQVVRRIFSLYESGMGKVGIAKALNVQHIPSPSAYKRLAGEGYCNGRRLSGTDYWTYATIHRILQNRTYAGDLEQGRDVRPAMHGKALRLDRSRWIIVPGTHEAIIDPEQFTRIQALLKRRGYIPAFGQSVNPFAGFLKCGDCGRAMAGSRAGGQIRYSCGSYKRYGACACTPHYLFGALLETAVLQDINRLLAGISDLPSLVKTELQNEPPAVAPEESRLRPALERVQRLQQSVYEDYAEGILPKEQYLRYQADYARQTEALSAQLAEREKAAAVAPVPPWIESLLDNGCLTVLDRATIAEIIQEIRVFEQGRIEIDYRFSPELKSLLETEEMQANNP